MFKWFKEQLEIRKDAKEIIRLEDRLDEILEIASKRANKNINRVPEFRDWLKDSERKEYSTLAEQHYKLMNKYETSSKYFSPRKDALKSDADENSFPASTQVTQDNHKEMELVFNGKGEYQMLSDGKPMSEFWVPASDNFGEWKRNPEFDAALDEFIKEKKNG